MYRILAVLLGLTFALGLTGCNLWGGIDSPSGDAQLLSAARSCLDQNDFACARNYYNQLSPAYNDVKIAELAFTTLEENGITMQMFASAFGNGKGTDVGAGITTMANQIFALGTAGRSLRVTIYNQFSQNRFITSLPDAKNLLKFLGAVSFASEILAEVIKERGADHLTQAGVRNTTIAIGAAGQVGGQTTLAALNGVTTNIDVATPTLDMFNVALGDVSAAITGFNASGSLASGFNTLITALNAAAAVSDAAYKNALVAGNVGSLQ